MIGTYVIPEPKPVKADEDPTFTFPKTQNSRALSGAVKTRRHPSGKGFQAVAAFWFGGIRQNLRYFDGETRYKAQAAAYRWLEA